MNIKKLICTAGSRGIGCSACFAAQSANVVVNGKQISDEAYLINDKTYVPLRAVGESFGAHVMGRCKRHGLRKIFGGRCGDKRY